MRKWDKQGDQYESRPHSLCFRRYESPDYRRGIGSRKAYVTSEGPARFRSPEPVSTTRRKGWANRERREERGVRIALGKAESGLPTVVSIRGRGRE